MKKEFARTMVQDKIIKTNIKHTQISAIVRALREKGYSPELQLAGFLVSSEPTYITAHNAARKQCVEIGRDEMLEFILEAYIQKFCEDEKMNE